MNKIDWSVYKFRSSSLPSLMVKPRAASEVLSETAKSYLREIYIQEIFSREKYNTASKYTDKGIACESDSLDLVQKVTKETYFKNKKELSNDFIKGTPDVILKDMIKDIKTSWDIWTFSAVDEDSAKKTYYHQLLGYMWLTGTKQADLIYCLVNTPPEIIADELYKLSFRYPEIGTSDEADAKYKKNYLFDEIDPALRMKSFKLEYSEVDIEILKMRITEARKYLEGMTL